MLSDLSKTSFHILNIIGLFIAMPLLTTTTSGQTAQFWLKQNSMLYRVCQHIHTAVPVTLMYRVKKDPLSHVTPYQDSKTMGDARKAKWTVYFTPDACSRKGLCISLILGQRLLFFQS